MASSMPPKEVIIFLGGAFNPVHTNHIELFELAKNHLEKNSDFKVIEGYLVPALDSYVRNKVKDVLAIKSEHRLAMCNLAIQKYDWIKPINKCYASAFEFARQLSKKKDFQIAIITGGDRALGKNTPIWRKPKKNDSITLMLGRAGATEELKKLWLNDLNNNKIVNPSLYYFIDYEPRNISSTLIREQLAILNYDLPLDEYECMLNKLVDDDFITRDVSNYILENKKDLFF